MAAIGAGAWLGRVLFGWHALDVQVPLLAFLFLVALGVDYTVFLVHRARAEARTVGTRAGMVTALATTGGVITSAGVVLAGVTVDVPVGVTVKEPLREPVTRHSELLPGEG